MTPERLGELREDDARARRSAHEVFDRPLVLEAGAGTGKTTALVTRILAWCFGPGWEASRAALAAEGGGAPEPERVASRVLQRIVAITFTEAAAAKMGEEVAAALLDVERGAPSEWLPREILPPGTDEPTHRARALRGALDHLGAQTIHAWCRRLLVTHPLEAGLHPQLEIDAEQRLQQEIARDVLEENLSAAYDADSSDALELAALGGGPSELEQQLLRLLEEGVRAADLEADPLLPERLEALRVRALACLEAFAAGGGDELAKAKRARKSRETIETLAAVQAKLAEGPWRDADALAWLEERWDSRMRGRVADWARGKFGQEEGKLLGGAAEAFARAASRLLRLIVHLEALDPGRLELARRVLAPLLAEVERRMRARGATTFSALLTGASGLLARRPDVATRVRAGIDQLLVDEFQDTDLRQCDILRAVALDGAVESRPGLFIVGDPKQSIYGWRSADLRAYDGFVADVEGAGGLVERLSVNYRSVPAVLDEVERVIEPVMRHEEGLQPAFQPLVACEAKEALDGFSRGRSAPNEYWVSARWDSGEGEAARTRAAEASRIEARALARDLVALHEEGVAWSEAAVLFRSRGDFETYLSALREAHVPYAVEGDRSYYQRREVIEAAALVRCVLDPNDGLALVTALRSSVVGAPDAALVPLWAGGLPGRLATLARPDDEKLGELEELLRAVVAALPDDVPGLDRVAGWEHNALAFCRALALLRASFREEACDVFVERLRALTLLEVTEAARYLGAWRVANLDRFFRELSEQLAEGVDVHTVLRRLRRAVSEEERREEGVPRDLAEDAVQILTIHGAKGLDFDHVYVMQLHKGRGRDPVPGIDPGRAAGGWLEYRLLGTPTPGWDEVARERDRVEDAERVRALYVAMTRARERVVLAGLWPEFQRGGGRDGQAVGLVEARVGSVPDLASEMKRLAAAGDDRFDAGAARWVFLGLADQKATGRAGRRSDRGLPSLDECAASARALGAARAEAAARQARRFGGTATQRAHEAKLGDTAERRVRDAQPRRAAAGRAAARARAVGTAIHHVLEHFDFAAEPGAELARQHSILEVLVRAETEAALHDETLDEARTLLDQLAEGRLLARLRELGDAILYRELPVLLPADPAEGPVAYLSGVADLVYRDGDGHLVVVDYKTDRATGDDLEARVDAYRGQGAVYQRALREALDLAYEPRFELWFLRADEVR